MANQVESTSTALILRPDPLADAQGCFLRPARSAAEFIEHQATFLERIVAREYSIDSRAPIRGQYTAAPETDRVVARLFENVIRAPFLGNILVGYVGRDYGDGFDFRFERTLDTGCKVFQLVRPYWVCKATFRLPENIDLFSPYYRHDLAHGPFILLLE